MAVVEVEDGREHELEDAAEYEDGAGVEIVDELEFEAVDEGEVDREVEAYPAFVAAMTEVALGFGADPGGVARLRAMLGQTRVEGVSTDRGAMAWQGVIRGESEDYGACGSTTLDEWAANVVARVVGDGRTEAIRKELRRHGVAAFGFIARAA
jgi:hypothetical protein